MAPTSVSERQQPVATADLKASLASSSFSSSATNINGVSQADLNKLKDVLDIEALYKSFANTTFKAQDEGKYEHASLRPDFPDIKWPALKELDVTDVGIRADPEYTDLLSAAEKIEHLTPKFGTVLYGVKLETLTDAQRDQLARYTSFRGLVLFRNQKSFDIKSQLALGRHWGHLHRHATTAVPIAAREDDDFLDVHVVYGDEHRKANAAFTQTYLWHSDVTYELQPPGYTMLKLLQGPPTGGDTLWSSGYGLYDSLSPSLQKYLEEHTALHSANEQASDARANNKPVRREPVVTEHPLVRVHPVTGYKSVFVNPGFTRSIVGVPAGESKAILGYLFEQIATNVDHTARWKWDENDVALWDNRIAAHSASWGFFPHRRHAVRVTVTGEKPYYDPKGISQQSKINELLGREVIDKDGTKQGNYND